MSSTDSYIGHNYFLLIGVLRKYNDLKKEINNLETSWVNWNF